MNAAEDRLSELMDAATRALAPPIESILAEGERLGRRRRRRRRTAVATGTATVVLLAGVGAAAGLRYARVDRDDVAGAATVVHHPSRAPTAHGAPSPTALAGDATPTPTPTAPSTDVTVPINSQTAVEILRLDGGAAWKFGAYDPKNAARMVLLDVDVNDGLGLARVFVDIGTTAHSDIGPADCVLQNSLLQATGKYPTGEPPTSCVIRTYPDGDKVMQEVLQPINSKMYEYRVIAYRADGVVLEIIAANGDSGNALTEVTRARPPLSMAQWTAIALDRSWQLDVPVTMAEMTPSPGDGVGSLGLKSSSAQ